MRSNSMDSHPRPLPDLHPGTQAQVTDIQGGHGLQRRLLGLGIRRGTRVQVLHRRGRGVVVAAGGTRVALGGGIAERLLVRPTDG